MLSLDALNALPGQMRGHRFGPPGTGILPQQNSEGALKVMCTYVSAGPVHEGRGNASRSGEGPGCGLKTAWGKFLPDMQRSGLGPASDEAFEGVPHLKIVPTEGAGARCHTGDGDDAQGLPGTFCSRLPHPMSSHL